MWGAGWCDRGGKPCDRPHRLRGNKMSGRTLFAEIHRNSRGTCPSHVAVGRPAHRRNYRRSGRYDVRVSPPRSSNSRTTRRLIFTITGGQRTGVKSIEVHLQTFSTRPYRLRDVIDRESNLLRLPRRRDV